ncbi:MAG: AbgT family transporter [Bacteroidales bacterium]|nr:AbgT family transporter [Bacteroidales bacterium]
MGTNEIVRPVNLLSHDGIHRALLEMVDNFTGVAPLGIVPGNLTCHTVDHTRQVVKNVEIFGY